MPAMENRGLAIGSKGLNYEFPVFCKVETTKFLSLRNHHLCFDIGLLANHTGNHY